MIHKEGKTWVATLLIIYLICIYYLNFTKSSYYFPITLLLTIIVLLVVNFFRNPERKIPEANENKIYAPADGKVVVIEEVFEPEYFKSQQLLMIQSAKYGLTVEIRGWLVIF